MVLSKSLGALRSALLAGCTLRWVENGPSHVLTKSGYVVRTIPKKPKGMSARQWRRQKRVIQQASRTFGVSVAEMLEYREQIAAA